VTNELTDTLNLLYLMYILTRVLYSFFYVHCSMHGHSILIINKMQQVQVFITAMIRPCWK